MSSLWMLTEKMGMNNSQSPFANNYKLQGVVLKFVPDADNENPADIF